MRELFLLVKKTIEESNKPYIFSRSDGPITDVTDHPFEHDFERVSKACYRYHKVEFAERQFSFYFKYADGKPNVCVSLNNFAPSSTIRRVTRKKVGFFKSEEVYEDVPLNSAPIYRISAGQLCYITTVEESRELYKVYDDLIERCRNKKINSDKDIILNRLNNPLTLN